MNTRTSHTDNKKSREKIITDYIETQKEISLINSPQHKVCPQCGHLSQSDLCAFCNIKCKYMIVEFN